MFGSKLKSWMEAHLGRPRHKSTSHQNQKRAPKDSSTGLACSSGSSASASISSTTNSTSSSSTNTTTSSSNGSTTTAIAGDGLATLANNISFCNDPSSTTLDHLSHHLHPEKAFNFSSSVKTTSSVKVGALSSSTTASSEPVTASSATTTKVEGQILDRKNGGGGGCIVQQNGDTIGAREAEINSQALGENEHHHPQQQPLISSANCVGNNDSGCRTTVTTSTSNSTSILSGSFSNSLSSPDTGYSTDGYSPKSVYPALSFDSTSSSSAGNTTSATSTSKSSYTISSLVSSELLHSSKQTTSSSLSSRTSCSIQNGLDDYASTAPSPSSPAALTSSTPFSQSTSSGISSSTSDSNCFPKGHQVHHHHHESSLRSIQQKQQHHHSLQQQHSIPEDDTEKQQVIMGDAAGDGEKEKKKGVELQAKQTHEQKLLTGTASKADTPTSTIDALAKFTQLSIDLQNQDIISNKHNVRTHRRAESMDARTPCHEDYKPLVEEPSLPASESHSSLLMTASQAKNIRTSFVINSSGQILEFSSYKNAYSICSPRRERTRIKTNPWITVKNRGNGGESNSNGDSISHANPVNNNSSSEEESVDKKRMNLNTTPNLSSSCIPSKSVISHNIPLESNILPGVGNIESRKQNEMNFGESVEKGNTTRPNNNRTIIGNSDGVNIDPTFTGRENLEINNRKVEGHDDHDDVEEDEHFVEDETGIIDHDSSSSLLYRISTSASASDSGKGTLEPGTNRNSTESSCLLSDSTTASTRNSIISHEAEQGSSRSGRSSSGESISSSHKHHHHHQPPDDDTLGHASPTSSTTGCAALLLTTEHQKQQHIHQSATAAKVNSSSNTVAISSNLKGKGESAIKNNGKATSTTSTTTEIAWGSEDQRTFRNAAVATDLAEISGFPKSASVSVGVGTTASNKSTKFHPIMVDKETDILSDWANTDEDGDEEIETDHNDNETVTPVPSSPDVDRGLFSQSTSSATTDLDFGDSSAATQASSTAVFPPSSLVRHHRYKSSSCNNNNSNKSGFNRGNGPKIHNNNENNGFPNGGSGSGGEDDVMLSTSSPSQMLPGSYGHHQSHYAHQHNINMNLAGAPCYPSVPIIRPVLSAASQHQGPNAITESYAYDITTASVLVNHHGVGELANQHRLHTFHPHASDTTGMCFKSGGVVPNFNLDDETIYPELKESSSHHKGLARGALGFLRKIFKKGACASQRRSPDSAKGKKSRGKSDNNLSALGLGSPLLTISEPLSNPRYSAVLTTKKQMNPVGYFLTPTPNSFRRRSGTGTDSSDSKGSKQHGTTKSVKTDIIRLPLGPISPQLHQQHTLIHQHQPAHQTSSHSSGSSCSSTNGIPQHQLPTCSTFLSPSSTNAHHLSGILCEENNLVITSQSNTNTNNSSSTSSSVHSLMSTSTSAASAGVNGTQKRPPSQNQSHTPVPHLDPNYYVNSSPASRQSSASSASIGNNNAHVNRHSMSPPPLISENCPYFNETKNPSHQPNFQQSSNGQMQHTSSRRDSNIHSQSPSIKGVLPYESPRLSTAARMSSPSFNNYSPIHRLVVTGGSHLLNKPNTNCPIGGNFTTSGITMPFPVSTGGESPIPTSRYNNHPHSMGNGNNYGNEGMVGNNNPNPAGFAINTQIINRASTGNQPTTSPSPLINHRYSATSIPTTHPYSSTTTSSQQQQQQQQQNLPGHLFASPSPILRNPRYQHITSSNQNSPILNGSKRINIIPPFHSHFIPPNGSTSNGLSSNPNGPPPLLTTFAPLPSSSSAIPLAPRESLMNSNSFNTNTITGSPNLNSSDPFNLRPKQVVSTSLSYNEFENLARQQQSYLFHNNYNNNGTNTQRHSLLPSQQHPPPNLFHQHHNAISHQQQQLLHQSQKSEIHHKNHYYSSPIVKGIQQQALHPPETNVKQTLWENSRETMMMSGVCHNNDSLRQYQQRMNQNQRFNSFLVRHRQLPQFYHTQWGLQERIYETVDSEEENSRSDEMSGGGGGDAEYDQDGNEIDCTSELSLPVEVHRRKLRHSYSKDEVEQAAFEQSESRNENGEYAVQRRKNNSVGYGDCNDDAEPNSLHNEIHPETFTNKKSKRSKPKSLSASGKPFPRPLVALPMMPGTFLSATETRLLEADNEADRKYKRLINEAEALLKEISVEKTKRVGDGSHDNTFRFEDCPQSDPLRRKAYDCWALRRLQQELAGCCASPPVLHRSRLNLQSPSTPVGNNPYLSHFQNHALAMSAVPPPTHQEVSYANSTGVDNNQNSFEF